MITNEQKQTIKLEFLRKIVIRYKGIHYILIKELILQDITIIGHTHLTIELQNTTNKQ